MAQKKLRFDGVWRVPDEESLDLYPGLVVHDGRVTGSITVGPTRLPLWAIIGEFAHHGWEGVRQGWPQIEDYGFSADDFSLFLYNLLEMRGEFGRLVLLLANAERKSNSPRAISDAWWENQKQRKLVRDQLRRCLDILEGNP